MSFLGSKPGMVVFWSLTFLIAAATEGCQQRPGTASLHNARMPEIPAGASGVLDLRVAHAGLPDYEMRIESAPAGAQVVVEGQPLAKTPCRVLINGSPTGFFLDELCVKARFIATDASGQSRTIEELFSKHDKIPAKLRFSPQGTKRTLRKE